MADFAQGGYQHELPDSARRLASENRGRIRSLLGKQDIESANIARRALVTNNKVDNSKKDGVSDKLNTENDGRIRSLLGKPEIEAINKDPPAIMINSQFDKDDNGIIQLDDLTRVAQDLGEAIERNELMQMLTEADLDGDSQITLEEFRKILAITDLVPLYDS